MMMPIMRLRKNGNGQEKSRKKNPIIKLNALLGPRVTYILLEQNDREPIIVYLLILPKLTHPLFV